MGRIKLPLPIEKKCNRCQLVKSIEHFPLRSETGRPREHCRECKREYEKEYRSTHKRKKSTPEQNREANLRRWYKIGQADYEKLSKSQANICAICGRPPRGTIKHDKYLCVDHKDTEETIEIRGLLCNYCNTALGFLDDDIDLLQKAIEYLQRTKQCPALSIRRVQ